MTAIALASFKEALRKRLIHLIGILTVVYWILLTLLTYFAYHNMKDYGANHVMIVENIAAIISLVGFYFSSMIIAFVTIMASVGAISSELESGVIHSIVTKPMKRTQYVIGKYLGIGALVVIYSLLLYTAIFIINIAINVPPLNHCGFLTYLKGLVFFTLEPLTILALCILGSVYFKTISNGIVVISIYILGTIGSMVEQIGAFANIENMVKWGIVSSLFSPFDVIYRKMVAIVFQSMGLSVTFTSPLFPNNSVPSNWMMAYVCLYLIVLLFLAVRKFNKKDIS